MLLNVSIIISPNVVFEPFITILERHQKFLLETLFIPFLLTIRDEVIGPIIQIVIFIVYILHLLHTCDELISRFSNVCCMDREVPLFFSNIISRGVRTILVLGLGYLQYMSMIILRLLELSFIFLEKKGIWILSRS